MTAEVFDCTFIQSNLLETKRNWCRIEKDCPHISRCDFDTLNLSLSIKFDAPCHDASVSQPCKIDDSCWIRVIGSVSNCPDLRPRLFEVELTSDNPKKVFFPDENGASNNKCSTKALPYSVRPRFVGSVKPVETLINIECRRVPQKQFERLSIGVLCKGYKGFGYLGRLAKSQQTTSSLAIAVPAVIATGGYGSPRKRVFFSYGWDPVDKRYLDNDYSDCPFEEPVNAIANALQVYESEIEILHDKTTMKPGDYISKFSSQTATGDVHLLIIFSSAKYWRSWWCMRECTHMLKAFHSTPLNFGSSIIVVEHPSGKIRTYDDVNKICDFWDDEGLNRTFPAAMVSEGLDATAIRKSYSQCVKEVVPKFTSDLIQVKFDWNDTADKNKVIMQIIKGIRVRLGLSEVREVEASGSG